MNEVGRRQALLWVEQFLELLDLHRGLAGPGLRVTPTGQVTRLSASEMRKLAEVEDEIRRRLPTAISLAGEVTPGNTDIRRLAGRGWEFQHVRRATLMLHGALRDAEGLERMLGPLGPHLSAGRLHPGVWREASALWDGGHYREAVQKAAAFVEEHLRLKLGVTDLSGVKLVNEAFSDKEGTANRPRLRFPTYQGESERNARVGTMQFGAGCISRIRNLATHHTDEIPDGVAIEQLAALSLFARWIDEAEVKSA